MASENVSSDLRKLPYEIYKYSSYSTSYLPENIREDCPSNQTSRWSSNTNTPPQFLTLRLQRPAIVEKIKFGKHEKTHVCNLKKFNIFGGLEEDHFVQLFEGGLRNDSTPETFKMRHITDSGEQLPIIFVQIMPLLSWGPSFNFSIWYVELLGQDDPVYMRDSLRNYNMLREQEIVRLCLKHFRQRGYEGAFKALQDHTSVNLEHPMMSELHAALVTNGEFNETEKLVEYFVDEGLFDAYLSRQDYKATWTLKTCNSQERPGMRGGHQLTVDSNNSMMYLFGGWDGFEDLSDLWSYDIKQNSWTLIHERAELFDGPGPRSCHKMLYDPSSSQIFTLGRYLDGNRRTCRYIQSDFYLFDTVAKTWLLISEDTSQVGGPSLMFDHQMCIDVAKRMIYVFGGRILTPRNIDDLANDTLFSGLFSYHISTNTWTQILVDCAHPCASNPDVLSIKSRVTHSMLFHQRHRKLYIFGGQRNKEYTTDFLSFDVDSQELAVVNNDHINSEGKNMPPSGFTQRATIDCERDEIYVLSSLSKEKERRDLNLNSFWMFSLKTGKWTCVYRCDHSASQSCLSKKTDFNFSEPCPRYAHQLVYDWNKKVHYLFGGNPGKNTSPQLRLNDFWILNLFKPSRLQISRHCKYLIRKLQYEEIARVNTLKALHFLQTDLFEIINHKDPVQLKEFHKLTSLLFRSDDALPSSEGECAVGKSSAASQTDCTGEASSSIASPPSSLSSSSDVPKNYAKCSSKECSYGGKDADEQSSSADRMLQRTGKFDEHQYDTKTQRCLLYNKIVELLPDNMVQPKGNLSDFVLV